MALSDSEALRPQLFICSFVNSPSLSQDLAQFLSQEHFHLLQANSANDFFEIVEQRKHEIDCLLLEADPNLEQIVAALHQQATLLPAVVLDDFRQLNGSSVSQSNSQRDSRDSQSAVSLPTQPNPVEERSKLHYHRAEVRLPVLQLSQVAAQINQAISGFLKLSPACRIAPPQLTLLHPDEKAVETFVTTQQNRLAEKLKERLGYLGIYYKRDPQLFLRHLPDEDKQAFIAELITDYRQIILNYFHRDQGLNQKIDAFVNKAFFADISVSQLLEVHMELIDAFAKQLKLERRSEDILLDYRLTLIDILSHLCEMYRRSIPRDA